MKTSIIILNYNAGKLLENCVSSVLKTKNADFEVILVDNASSDNSHIKCKEKFPNIKLIENKTNVGYCEGNNIGLKEAKGDFIVFLNPDTEVEPDWINEFFNAFDIHGDALYQAKLLDLDDKKKFNTSGNMITIFGFVYLRGIGEKDLGQYDKIERIGWPSGTCLFTSRKTLEKTGSFDPDYFAYYEDVSLGWRSALLGINSYYVPKAIAYHKSGYVFKKNARKVHLLQRNRWYILLTHYSKKTYFRILPGLILLEIIVFLFYLSTGMGKGMILAYRDIIKNRKLLKKKYNEIQKNRMLSDKEIISNFMYIPKFKIIRTSTEGIFYRIINVLDKISLFFL